jgi:TolB-like protein
MNARVEFPCALTQDGVWQAVRSMLASPVFAKAPRMCHLLSFLVEKKLVGKENEITEYAIGLEVFRRDARVYDTVLDPVVRVQIGRLRGRLVDYYAAAEVPLGVEISIPQGSYVPLISQAATVQAGHCRRQLELVPLRSLMAEHDSKTFVSGLDEELGSRLFQAFGSLIQLSAHPTSAWDDGGAGERAPQRLEGSIRVENNHVRASMRLVDTAAGHIAWLSQFDCTGELGMNLQEKLAGAICAKLQRYLADH